MVGIVFFVRLQSTVISLRGDAFFLLLIHFLCITTRNTTLYSASALSLGRYSVSPYLGANSTYITSSAIASSCLLPTSHDKHKHSEWANDDDEDDPDSISSAFQMGHGVLGLSFTRWSVAGSPFPREPSGKPHSNANRNCFVPRRQSSF